MPIDPSIPLQAKNVQLESPINQLGMMNEALKYNEMNRSIGEQNKLNEYLKSGVDLSSAEGKRGLLNYGKTGIAQAKAIGDMEKASLENKKLTGEVDSAQRIGAVQRVIGAPDAATAASIIQAGIADGSVPAAHGNDMLKQLSAMSYPDWQINIIRSVVKPSEMLTPDIKNYNYGKQNPEFNNYQTAQKRASATQVNMGGQPEFIKGVGKNLSEDFTKEFTATSNSAQSAAENLPKLYETLNLVNDSDAITGIGSDVLKNVERVKAQFLADKNAGKKVSDTEVLDAMLGSDVFPMIQSLGVGARGMDTPAEREFLRGVMTGTTALDKNTLKRMTEIRINLAKRAIQRYNSNVESGKYKPVESAQGSALPRIDTPEFTGASSKAKKINNDAEYNALPAGAIFIDPDGNQRRKP